MFDAIRKTLRKATDSFLGTDDWKTMIKENGPLNPADMRSNEGKYKEMLLKAKEKRKKVQSGPLLPVKLKKTSYLKKAVSDQMDSSDEA